MEKERECKGKCAFCSSENVVYGITELDGQMLGYEISCNDCGASGFEWYDLKYTSTFMTKN